jgi:hypothetical protein
MDAVEVIGLIAKLANAIVEAKKSGATHIDVDAIKADHAASEKSARAAAEERLHERFDKGGEG